jgi:hypothetical protein
MGYTVTLDRVNSQTEGPYWFRRVCPNSIGSN